MRELAGHPVLSELWAYWRRQRQGVRLPARSGIDPVEIPALLPHLQFVERAEDGEFRYRLTGTAIVDAFSVDPTGKLIRDVLPPARLAMARRHFSKVWASGRPIWSRSSYEASSGLEQIVTRIILPLAEDGKSVNVLLLGVVFEGMWNSFKRTGVDWRIRSGDDWGFLGEHHIGAIAA